MQSLLTHRGPGTPQVDAFMEEQSRFDTHGTLCTTPLLLNLMLSEYLRREAQDSAIQFDGAAALVCLRAHLPLSPLPQHCPQ